MDVLRENIGLLQLPYENEYYYDEETINEFTLPWQKKSRWQRFKDAIKSQNGRNLVGALALGSSIGLHYYASKQQDKNHRQRMTFAKNAANSIRNMSKPDLSIKADVSGLKNTVDRLQKYTPDDLDPRVRARYNFIHSPEGQQSEQRFKDFLKRNGRG